MVKPSVTLTRALCEARKGVVGLDITALRVLMNGQSHCPDEDIHDP